MKNKKDKKDKKINSRRHRKEKNNSKILIILSIILLFSSALLIILYCILNKKNYVIYSESANMNYGFNLIENEFYKTDYIDENIDVIADLVKNFNFTFNYNLDLSEEMEYTYNYKVIANMKLKDKSKTNLIYNDEEIISQKELNTEKGKELVLSDNFSIDYQQYNEKVKKMIEQFKLDNTESNLSFTVYLDLKDNETGKVINSNKEILSIEVPLDSKTVEAEINNNVSNQEEKLILNTNENKYLKVCLIMGIILLAGGVVTLLILKKHILEARSAEEIYNDELKKILFDYKSYIQKINTKIDFSSYKIIEVSSFNELFGIREDVQLPILMYTENKSNSTCFIIIKDNIIFAYTLGEQLINKRLLNGSGE